MRRSLTLGVLAVLAALAFVVSGVRAQEAAGKVVGTITDQQGAVIPGAKVTVTNVATGVISSGTTDKNGYFEVLNLPIGSYSVTVEQSGFQKTTTQAEQLQINQTLRFNVSLKVAQASESVTVEAQVTRVETENPTVGGSVIGQEIQNAPLNGRDPLQLAMLQPGVTGSAGAGNFNIAGGRADSITYLLDGGMNNDLLDNGVVYDPNPDTVAEFRILTSNYTAEYGRNGGGIISVVTKSGTNSIHGSAFEYNRNRDFNANNFFNNFEGLPRNALIRNQFGGTIGGPITIPHIVNGHDKLFFFANYQGTRQLEPVSSSNASTFTPAQLSGNFSGDTALGCFLQGEEQNPAGPGLVPCSDVQGDLPGAPSAHSFFALFPGTTDPTKLAIIDPTKINPAAAAIIAAGLLPTSPTGLLNTEAPSTANDDELTGKVDLVASEKDKFSFTVGGLRSDSLNPFVHSALPGFPSKDNFNTYFGGFSYVRTFSSTLLNEFHANYQRRNIFQSQPARTLPGPAAFGFGITPDLVIGPPDLNFDTGLALGFSVQGPSNLIGNTYVYSDVLTMIKGNNTWKFGGGFSAYQQNMVFAFFDAGEFFFQGGDLANNGAAGTGNSFADFLLGIPNNLFEGPNAPSNIRQKTTYAFGQDEWRLKSNLTLTLGLRYEYSSPKLDTEGRTFSFIPGDQSTRFVNSPNGFVFPGDAGAPRGSNFSDKDNFAPRIGFAWDPTGKGKTSIRGGGGIFYDVLKAEDNFQFNGAAPFFSEAGPPFYPFVPSSQSTTIPFFAQPFTSSGFFTSNPFPSTPPTQNVDFGAAGFLPLNSGGGVFMVDPHLHTPYTYQYNLSVEQQVARGLVAEVNYVGSDSKGLTSLVDINPFELATVNNIKGCPGCVRMLDDPGITQPAAVSSFCAGDTITCPFVSLPEFQNISFASFNSIEASLTKQVGDNRFFGNSYFTLAYTHGRSIDNTSGFRSASSQVPFYSHGALKGVSDFDTPHRITFSGGWTLPFDRAWSSGPKRLLKGWGLYPILTWQTGFPFNVGAQLSGNPTHPGPSGAGDGFLANALFNTAGGFNKLTLINNVRNNSTFNNPNNVNGTNLPTTANYFFDPNTFVCQPPPNSQNGPTPCGPSFGSANPYGLPRNAFRGPGMTNLDIALAKNTQLYENLNLQLRLEAFNVFNHAQFQNPDTNGFSPTFGQITSAADPRILQVSARLTF